MKTSASLFICVLLIFNTSFVFAQYTKLFDFNEVNGTQPSGDLISDGTYLYGMTSHGGANNQGVIFKIKPDGTGYVTLLDFDGTNGAYPYGSLIFNNGGGTSARKSLANDTYLYGVALYGAANNKGLIFKIKTDGTGFTDMHDFNGTDGTSPIRALASDGTYLYGITNSGGSNGKGVIFKIKPDGTNYSKLHDFNGTEGEMPSSSLLIRGNYMYGMTSGGGNASGYGVIFKMKLDGTDYSVLHNFNFNNGAKPYGALITDGTYLYGMTSYGMTSAGDPNGYGGVFKIKLDGTGYNVILDFGGLNGKYPYGALLSDGIFLYGITGYSDPMFNDGGGLYNDGVMFKIKPDGTNYTKLHDFNGVNGKDALGSLIRDGLTFYGMTSQGGVNTNSNNPNGCGVIFKYEIPCTLTVTATSNTSLVCLGNPVVLTGSGAISYTWWETNSGIVLTGETVSVIPHANATTYSVIGSYDNLCTDTATIAITVDACIGIDELNNINQIKIYPNPVNEILNVEFVGSGKSSVGSSEVENLIIYNLLGDVIKNERLKSKINVSDLQKGIYFVKLGNSTTKFVKE